MTLTPQDLQRLEDLRSAALQRCRDQGDCWILSSSDPTEWLHSYSPLRLKSAYRLALYETDGQHGSKSRLFAIPIETKPDLRFYSEPCPQSALAHFTQALEGDGSDWSYLVASMLARDGEELGASGNFVAWGYRFPVESAPFLDSPQLQQGGNLLVDYLLQNGIDLFSIATRYLSEPINDPNRAEEQLRTRAWTQKQLQALAHRFWCDQRDKNNRDFSYPPEVDQIRKLFDADLTDWKWHTAFPADWPPQVRVGEKIEVTFYTASRSEPKNIIRHHDCYTPLDYCPQRTDTEVATGPGIFGFF